MQLNGNVGLKQNDQTSSERPKGKPSQSKLLQLLEFQQFKCALSGVELTPQVASIDHIVPLSADGDNVMENLQVVHADINQMKSTMPIEEFIRWCKLVADKSEKN